MKDKYRSMMNHLTLSPAARSSIEEQIARAPKTAKQTGHSLRRIAIAAACMLLMVAAAKTPILANTVYTMEKMLASVAEELNYKATDVLYESNDGNFVAAVSEDENGNKVGGIYGMAGAVPEWLMEDNGRLYFTGNGEMIDITDQISYEKPFTYTYTDDEQLIHYIAVGGEYDGDLNSTNTGWSEWLQNAPGTEPMMPNSPDGWIGGYADHHMNIADNIVDSTEHPWYTAAEEEFDVPWK